MSKDLSVILLGCCGFLALGVNPVSEAASPRASAETSATDPGHILGKKAEIALAQDLSKVRLSQAVEEIANSSRKNLAGSDLRKESLNFADLRGAELSNVNLAGSSLVAVKLTEALLDDSDLSKANLSYCNLDGASLRNADLTGASIFDSSFRGSDFSGVNLSSTSIWRSDFTGADLSGAIFTGAELIGVYFEPARLPEPESLIGVYGLRYLRVNKSYAPLEELRDRAYARGLHGIGSELTCAIQRNKNDSPDRPWLRQFLSFYLFDATCAYGASPLRLLGLLGFLTFFHVLVVGWNVDTESRDGRIRVTYNGKNGNKQVVYLASVLRVLGRKKSFEGRAWSLTITMFAVALLTVRVLFGRRLAEKASNIFSKRPFVLVANGVLRIWVFLYVLGALFLLLLWTGSQYGRIFG